MCLLGNTGGEQVDVQTAQEDTEDKLKQCIDNLMDKRYVSSKNTNTVLYRLGCCTCGSKVCVLCLSAKTRLTGLESLRQAFSSKQLYDFLTERRITISDCLERSLKKGKTRHVRCTDRGLMLSLNAIYLCHHIPAKFCSPCSETLHAVFFLKARYYAEFIVT